MNIYFYLFKFLPFLLLYRFEHFLTNTWIFFNVYSIIKYQRLLYPRPLTVVNVLGSQKCALSLDIP